MDSGSQKFQSSKNESPSTHRNQSNTTKVKSLNQPETKDRYSKKG